MFVCEDANGDNDGDNEAFAFVSGGEIVIIGDAGTASLQVIDVLGHVVYQGDAMNRVSTGGFVPGVYVLRMIDGNNVKTQKMVIQ